MACVSRSPSSTWRPIVMEDGNGERGLLGLAFPPDAAWTGRAFIFFSSRNGRGDSMVARFTRMPGDPLRLDPASRFDLEFAPGQRYIAQPDDIHKAGKMVFGHDGYLYIGVGDGGPIWDPYNTQPVAERAARKDSADRRQRAGQRSHGLRRAARQSVRRPRPARALKSGRSACAIRGGSALDDPARGGTGALVIADVGQDDWEEVNYQPAGVGGRNYGWSLREGKHDLDKPDGIPRCRRRPRSRR